MWVADFGACGISIQKLNNKGHMIFTEEDMEGKPRQINNEFES